MEVWANGRRERKDGGPKLEARGSFPSWAGTGAESVVVCRDSVTGGFVSHGVFRKQFLWTCHHRFSTWTSVGSSPASHSHTVHSPTHPGLCRSWGRPRFWDREGHGRGKAALATEEPWQIRDHVQVTWKPSGVWSSTSTHGENSVTWEIKNRNFIEETVRTISACSLSRASNEWNSNC